MKQALVFFLVQNEGKDYLAKEIEGNYKQEDKPKTKEQYTKQ